MASEVPTIRLNFLSPILEEVEVRGFSADQILNEFNISRSAFNEFLLVPAPTMYDMVTRASQISDEPFLGWQMGFRFDIAQAPFLQHSRSKPTTVFETLTDFLIMAEQHATSQVYSLIITGSQCRLYGRRTFKPKTDVSQVDAWDVGVWTSYLKRVLGDVFDAKEITVRLYNPSAIPSGFFNPANILAGNNMGCELTFPTKWLNLNQSTGEGGLRYPKMHTSAALQEVLSVYETGKLPTLPIVAKQCGVHPRKLQRMLRKSGKTFQQIIDQHQKQRAIGLLCDTELPISEISALLGYSDISNFGRSFRRWTGKSPQAFRKLP